AGLAVDHVREQVRVGEAGRVATAAAVVGDIGENGEGDEEEGDERVRRLEAHRAGARSGAGKAAAFALCEPPSSLRLNGRARKKPVSVRSQSPSVLTTTCRAPAPASSAASVRRSSAAAAAKRRRRTALAVFTRSCRPVSG